RETTSASSIEPGRRCEPGNWRTRSSDSLSNGGFMKRTVIVFASLIALLIFPLSGQEKVRVEKDLLGEKKIPADAYYGVQTARALENFQLSGVLINHYPGFIEAWAMVKLAAARANTDVGAMKKDRLDAIEKASQAVLDGKY